MKYYIQNSVLTLAFVLYSTFAYAQENICFSVGKLEYALWEDKWTPAYPATIYGFYTKSFCPTWAGRLPAAQSSTGKPTCYAQMPIAPMNSGTSGYGHCRQPVNSYTRECMTGEACLTAMQYTPYAYICDPLVTTAITTWDSPGRIDCNNMNRKWRDNWGGTWYIQQTDKQRQVTGWIDTNTSYQARAKCGWWQITGSVSDQGYTYIDAKFYGTTPPRSSCLKQMAYSGTTTASQSTGTFLNARGQQGSFTLYSLEPPPGFNWFNWTPLNPQVLTTPEPWTIY